METQSKRGNQIIAPLVFLLLPVAALAQPSPTPRFILDRISFDLDNARIAFSPDSTVLVSGGRPHSLKLWDARSGKLIVDLAADPTVDIPEVTSLCFSRDGKMLVVGGSEGILQLWETQGDSTKRKARFTLKGHSSEVLCLSFSPDGKTLASGGMDGTVKLWDWPARKVRSPLRGQGNGTHSLTFSADGSLVISGDGDGNIHLWDSQTGRLRDALKGPRGLVTSLALSPSGELLAACNAAGLVKVWSLAERKKLFSFQASEYVVFSSDSKYLIAGGGDSISVWQASTGRQIARYRTRYPHPHATAISPDGKTLAAGLDNGRILLWDVASLLERKN